MLSVTAITVAALAVIAGGCVVLVYALVAMSGKAEREYEAEMLRQWRAERDRRDRMHAIPADQDVERHA